MATTIVINILKEDQILIKDLEAIENVDCQVLKRSRLTGAEVVSIITSIAPAAIPIVWDIIRKYIKSKKTITVEWNGHKFENLSENNIEELLKLITEENEKQAKNLATKSAKKNQAKPAKKNRSKNS